MVWHIPSDVDLQAHLFKLPFNLPSDNRALRHGLTGHVGPGRPEVYHPRMIAPPPGLLSWPLFPLSGGGPSGQQTLPQVAMFRPVADMMNTAGSSIRRSTIEFGTPARAGMGGPQDHFTER